MQMYQLTVSVETLVVALAPDPDSHDLLMEVHILVCVTSVRPRVAKQ